MQRSNQLVFPIFTNYGYFGVQENKLITDDKDLRCLVKYFNRDRAKSMEVGERLDCNIEKWNLHDWYEENRCIQQMNNIHLETALERKEISSNKLPVYFGTGNMASLLYQFVLYYPDFREQDISNREDFSKFDFDPQTGLRFISKVSCKDQFWPALGHIAEHLLVTDADIQDRTIEIGKELIYSINSLDFPDSNAILYYSKEVDCFWNKEAPLDMKNACEVKAVNAFFGVKQHKLLIKAFALGGIRRLIKAINHESIISKVEIEDLESFDTEKIVDFFYACLNNFTNIVIKNCLENELTSGIIRTYRTAFGRFLVISQEDYFWCHQFNPQTASFVGGQKFPSNLTAIRWPISTLTPRFDRYRIRNIQIYNIYDYLNTKRKLHYADGNCLLVVEKDIELNLDVTRRFQYKVSLEDPMFDLVKHLLLEKYYAALQNEDCSLCF